MVFEKKFKHHSILLTHIFTRKETLIMRIYHGTTIENGLDIKNHIPKSQKSVTWNVSKKDCMYFWINPEQTDNISDTERQNQCLTHALESAQITAAVHRSTNSDLAIITYDINPEDINNFSDLSCANMGGSLEIPLTYLDFTKLNFYKATNIMIPEVSLLYLINIDDTMLHLDQKMKKHLELIKTTCFNQTEYLLEELLYPAWQTSINDLQPLI